MFLFNRLTFGHKNAPAHFQKIMQTVVDESDDVVVIYLDLYYDFCRSVGYSVESCDSE